MTVAWGLREGALDQRAARRGQARHELARVGRECVEVSLLDGSNIVRGERRPAREEMIIGRTQRVDVRGGGGRLATPDLRGGVVGRADAQVRVSGLEASEPERHAEVAQLGDAARPEEQVRGLHVAVDDAAAVRGVQRPRRLHEDVGGPDGRQCSARRDRRLARGAGDVLHRDVAMVGVARDGVDLDDAWVVDAGDEPRLGEEPLDGVLAARLGDAPREDLDGRRAEEGLVVGEVDRPHPAAPDQALQTIVPELEAGEAGQVSRLAGPSFGGWRHGRHGRWAQDLVPGPSLREASSSSLKTLSRIACESSATSIVDDAAGVAPSRSKANSPSCQLTRARMVCSI